MAAVTDRGPVRSAVGTVGPAGAQPVDRLSDEALLAGFGAGDAEIGLAFVRRFQARVHGTALAVLGDPRAAEDVAQQAFERAWRHASSYDPLRASVLTWLNTITRRLAIDTARVRRPVPVDAGAMLDAVVSPGRGPEAVALAEETADRLRAALVRLPAAQARAVVLAGIVGLSAQQVADSESIPLGTAKTRIRTALRRLRADMDIDRERP